MCPLNLNLNNVTNPFIKEIYKSNEIILDKEDSCDNSEETEKEQEKDDQIKKMNDIMIEKITLVGDKTKKTNNYYYYYQTLIYSNKKFIINYTRKAAEKYNNVKEF